MSYFVEILLFTPFLYALPLFTARALFGVKSKKQNVFAYLFTTGGSLLVVFWLLQTINQIPLRTIISLILILIMFLIYIKTELTTTIYVFLITVCTSIICELCVYMISSMSFAGNYIFFNSDKETTLQFNLITFVSAYIIIYSVYFARKNNLKLTISVNQEILVISAAIVMIVGFAVFIVMDNELFSLFNINAPNLRHIFVEINVFVFLAIFMCIMLIRQIFREKRKNTELIQAQAALTELYDTTRLFRHNYNNSLIALTGYCNNGDIEGLRKMLSGLNQEAAEVNLMESLPGIIKIEDSGFRWLLLSKYSFALNKGIAFTSTVTYGIDKSLLEKKDFQAILGILLDNAIDAAGISEKKIVKFSIVTIKDDVVMSIYNSFSKKPDINRIFEKSYTTKEGHDGFGLYSVKKILNKYSNVLIDVVVENNTFSIDINIQNGDLMII